MKEQTLKAPSRPLLRYHGGKWKLAPWIISHFPPHRVYVEPFGGAASVLLRKPRSYAEVYNDLDGELGNLFRVVRDRGEALVTALYLTPFSRGEFEQSYEPCADAVEQARRTICRAYMGFGSDAHHRATGFRANSNRSGTTPAHDWSNFPAALVTIIERLRGVVIETREAHDVMAAADGPQTLHYVDPPYVASTRDKGSDYRFEMTDADHRTLAAFVRSLAGMVVISGYASPLYDSLYGDWRRVEVAALADGAKARTEVLWISPNTPCQQAPDMFTGRAEA